MNSSPLYNLTKITRNSAVSRHEEYFSLSNLTRKATIRGGSRGENCGGAGSMFGLLSDTPRYELVNT